MGLKINQTRYCKYKGTYELIVGLRICIQRKQCKIKKKKLNYAKLQLCLQIFIPALMIRDLT